MKKFLFIIVCTITLQGCTKDAEILTEDYPFVIMEGATVIDKLVVLEAKVLNIGEVNVTSFGFLWDINNKLSFDTSFFVEIDEIDENGRYSFKIESDLIEDKNYYVRPFAKQSGKTVFGNEVSFTGCETEAPVILDFFPKEGFSGDTVRVVGNFFSTKKSRVKAKIGVDNAIVTKVNMQEVVFVLPQNLSVSAEVNIYIESGQHNVKSDSLFLIQGHRITDFHPKEGIIGEAEVTIEGFGFGNDQEGTVVKIGNNIVDVISFSDTQITVKLPYVMNAGNFPISVIRNQLLAQSSEDFRILTRWVPNHHFTGTLHTGRYFEKFGDKGYMISGNEVWLYHIDNNSWERLGDFPGNPRIDGVTFANNNFIYFGLGREDVFSNGFGDFWKLNIETQEWTQLEDYPDIFGYRFFGFAYENIGYLFGWHLIPGVESYTAVWSFDFISESWTHLGHYSENLHPVNVCSYFKYQDKVFIFNGGYWGSERILYEFDPDYEGFLKPIANYPLSITMYKIYPVVIEDDVFILHPTGFFKYSMISGVLTRLESIPGQGAFASFSFSKNGQAYFFFTFPYPSSPSPLQWIYNPGLH